MLNIQRLLVRMLVLLATGASNSNFFGQSAGICNKCILFKFLGQQAGKGKCYSIKFLWSDGGW
jgi:hypothetical protein